MKVYWPLLIQPRVNYYSMHYSFINSIIIGNYNHWTGFRIVGDNVDKNVRPRYQRLDYQTQSLHHFHSYACLDRIDFSGLSDSSPLGVVTQACLTTDDELSTITSHLEILVSRFVACIL